MTALQSVLLMILDLFWWLIIIWVILGWLQAYRIIPYNQFVHTVMNVLFRLTDPILSLFRRVIPPGGGIDFSPFLAIIAIWILKALVIDLL